MAGSPFTLSLPASVSQTAFLMLLTRIVQPKWYNSTRITKLVYNDSKNSIVAVLKNGREMMLRFRDTPFTSQKNGKMKVTYSPYEGAIEKLFELADTLNPLPEDRKIIYASPMDSYVICMSFYLTKQERIFLDARAHWESIGREIPHWLVDNRGIPQNVIDEFMEKYHAARVKQ